MGYESEMYQELNSDIKPRLAATEKKLDAIIKKLGIVLDEEEPKVEPVETEEKEEEKETV